MKAELRTIVNDNTTRKGRIFDYTVQVLIFSSLIAYALDTLPDNPPAMRAILRTIETVSAVLFTIEICFANLCCEKTFQIHI